MLVGVLGEEETLPWARRCNKLHSTICIALLSEFVSWNTWLQHPHFLKQPPARPSAPAESCARLGQGKGGAGMG